MNPTRLLKFFACCSLLTFLGFSDNSISHFDLVKIPENEKPGYLTPFRDPTFGTVITRVSDDPGNMIKNIDARWNKMARHGYSKDSAWNCDQTLLILKRHDGFPSKLFLDGSTFKPMFGHNTLPGSEMRWHPTRPEIMFYVNQDTIGFWNVRNNAKDIIKTFEGYSELSIGPWEGNLSFDGHKVVLVGKNGDQKVAFTYDLNQDKKYPDLKFENGSIDWVSISHSGKYMVANMRGDTTQVYDMNGKKIGALWSEYGRPSHYDLTLDMNGNDVAVGVSKSKPDEGKVIMRRLKDGKVTVLTRGGYAGHTSTRNVKRPGWAYVSYQYKGPNWPPYWDEIVAVKLDGSLDVERLAHIHTGSSDYLNQAHPVPSPDGQKVLWASSWDGTDPGTVQAYILDKTK